MWGGETWGQRYWTPTPWDTTPHCPEKPHMHMAVTLVSLLHWASGDKYKHAHDK